MRTYIQLIIILFHLFLLSACFKGEKVDLVIYNASIHTMDEKNTIHEAMAVNEGKIVAIGPEREILNRFRGFTEINAKKKDILPGIHDSHGHLIGLAFKRLEVDLSGSKSKYDVLLRLEKHVSKNENIEFVLGWGWDQSIWGDSVLPSNELLNERFPNTPVILSRIDAHTVLVNDKALKLAGITAETKVENGIVLVEENKPTGILIDKAVDLVYNLVPSPSKEAIKKEILAIQEELFAYGVTHVHEAGLYASDLSLLDEMASAQELKLNVYAMLFHNESTIAFAKKYGIYKNNSLNVRSFKLMIDGALGSEGACLTHPYATKKHHGLLLHSPEKIKELAELTKDLGYQMNTHCIGDSANRIMLQLIDTLFEKNDDHRWRIEHAQVVHPNDFQLFFDSDAIPSVQPTHAVSDYRWAESKLGSDRIQGAYAYKTLLEKRKMLLFGTDFPVEDINPFATLFAATKRKNTNNEPTNGFRTEEAVSLQDALKAMTIWAAYGIFEENRLGSLEKGKLATFVILDQPLVMKNYFEPNYANKTFINGELVYAMD